MRGNSIHDNATLGIDLVPIGVTANDVGDADDGPNNLQNFPTLTSARSGAGFTNVQGVLESISGGTFEIEIFVNAACDPSGNGEGESFLGSASVTTDATGVGSFSVITSGNVPIGSSLTATATDSDGNTSEFSTCQVVVVGAPPGLDTIPTLGATGLVALAVLLGLVGFLAVRR